MELLLLVLSDALSSFSNANMTYQRFNTRRLQLASVLYAVQALVLFAWKVIDIHEPDKCMSASTHEHAPSVQCVDRLRLPLYFYRPCASPENQSLLMSNRSRRKKLVTYATYAWSPRGRASACARSPRKSCLRTRERRHPCPCRHRAWYDLRSCSCALSREELKSVR